MKKLLSVFFILLISALFFYRGKLESVAARKRLSAILNDYDQHKSHKYTVYGYDDELFYLEDIRYCLLNWYGNGNNRKIAALARELDGKGIRLVVVPVPNKVEVYPSVSWVWMRRRFAVPGRFFFRT